MIVALRVCCQSLNETNNVDLALLKLVMNIYPFRFKNEQMTDRLADDRYRLRVLGPIYTEHQRQRFDDVSDTVRIWSQSEQYRQHHHSVVTDVQRKRNFTQHYLLLWKQHRLNSKIYNKKIQ